jgi:hypothetical protein
VDRYAGARWYKSSRSGGNDNCVEIAVALDGSGVGVRDSKAGPGGPVLDFHPDDFRAFVESIKAGEFDLPG